ncbi:hypothetical protein AAFF_G00318080 [Aldrovandia affinis]|uniref:DUF6570 domain-containing protein n=1 Tax=Aldrovandia affinis TaxID=143900 RepID=A0AAD7R6Z7_9TELE|nr:hypothetical protein AAFF_G00318080 [Aldrovandia affinis]
MPRKGKRSQTAKQRWQRLHLADQPISPSTQQTVQPETPPPDPSFWTKTDATTPSQSPAQKMAKLPIAVLAAPSCSRSKAEQFVLLVGDSHLRAIADGFVAMPDGALSFGVLSIPGASAAELRTEVLNVVLPRTPESVHLSDDAGMEILAQLLWVAASQQLERMTEVATVQRTSPRTSPPARRVSPKVVVKDEVAVPRPSNPFEWTVVGRTKKVDVWEHSIPRNPVWFSPAILDAMEEAVPSHLPSAVECRALAKGGTVEATASVMESSKPSPRSPGTVVMTEELGASHSDKPLQFTSQDRMQEWICHTCDGHLIKGGMPSIAVANSLELAAIPPELDELNVLERQLIVKILPFAKIVALPKGRQRVVHGAVVCVPSEVETMVNALPRPCRSPAVAAFAIIALTM